MAFYPCNNYNSNYHDYTIIFRQEIINKGSGGSIYVQHNNSFTYCRYIYAPITMTHFTIPLPTYSSGGNNYYFVINYTASCMESYLVMSAYTTQNTTAMPDPVSKASGSSTTITLSNSLAVVYVDT